MDARAFPLASIYQITMIFDKQKALRTFHWVTFLVLRHRRRRSRSSLKTTSPSFKSIVTLLSKFKSEFTNFLVMEQANYFKKLSPVSTTSTSNSHQSVRLTTSQSLPTINLGKLGALYLEASQPVTRNVELNAWPWLWYIPLYC